MLKSEFAERLAQNPRLLHLNVAEVVDNVALMLDIMADTLTHKGRIEIRGFGSFTTRYHPPRKAHNPKTSEHFITTGKYRPHFKAGKELRELIDKKSEK